jgi:WD40 repeat protein
LPSPAPDNNKNDNHRKSQTSTSHNDNNKNLCSSDSIRIQVGDNFHTIATSCNGEWIACGCLDGSVRLWNSRRALSTWAPISSVGPYPQQWILKEHSKQVSQVLFSPTDPHCLVSSSWDGTIRVWNLAAASLSLKQPQQQQKKNTDDTPTTGDLPPSDPPNDTMTIPTTTMVVTPTSFQLCSEAEPDGAAKLAFTPDGAFLASAYLLYFDPDPQTGCHSNIALFSMTACCNKNSDPSSTSSYCLRRWGTTATGDGRKLLQLAFYSTFASDRNNHNKDGDERSGDRDTDQTKDDSATRNQYYLSSLQWCDVLSEEICTWDITTFRTTKDNHNNDTAAVKAKNVQQLCTTNTLAPFATRVSIPRNCARPGAFSPNFSYTTTPPAAAAAAAAAATTNTTTGTNQKVYLATTHQGRRKILLWSLPYGQLELTLQRYPSGLTQATTRASTRSTRATTYNESHSTSDDPCGLCSLAFSPNGQVLASGWEDGCIYLWNIPSGSLRSIISTTQGGGGESSSSLTHHGVWSLVFVNQGQTIVSGDGSRWLQFWKIPPED